MPTDYTADTSGRTAQNATKKKPVYQIIKESILKNIHSGKWQAGDAIPTEHALADRFGVSRMTVNRALKELSEEQVLYRRQGSGTFVAQQQFNHTVVEVRNVAEDIRSTNKRYRAEVVSQQRLPYDAVPTHIAEHFTEPMIQEPQGHNPADTPYKDNASKQAPSNKSSLKPSYIDEVKIIHFADEVPVQLEERWVNVSIVPNFIDQDFRVVNTSDYLIAEAPLESGSYTIRAVSAPDQVAHALKIASGDPALLLSRQTYSAGKVVTFVNMWHAGSDYQFSGTL